MSALAYRLNYYALTVSILANCIPETAFLKLQGGRRKNKLTDADYDDMVKFRQQGVSLKEISEMYGGLDIGWISRKVKERRKDETRQKAKS